MLALMFENDLSTNAELTYQTARNRLIDYWKSRCKYFPSDLRAHEKLFDAFQNAKAYREAFQYWKEKALQSEGLKSISMRTRHVEVLM